MKRFALALLLSVAVCGAAMACPGGGPCTCPQPGQPQEIVVEVVEVADIATVAEQAVESAIALCDESAGKVGQLGPQAEMTYFGIRNSVGFLKQNGVSEDDLAPLVEASKTILNALKEAKPLYMKGMITAQYASLTKDEADGDPVGQLRAAALYCQAAECFSASAAALEGTEKAIEDAKATAQKLFESLQPAEPEADEECKDGVCPTPGKNPC